MAQVERQHQIAVDSMEVCVLYLFVCNVRGRGHGCMHMYMLAYLCVLYNI